ncbi:MAG TPA: xanthine dehydrogenase family protein molybdopterin-binding subunit [Candidatus Binatia bacterium]|jgi:CO/xanthine dehydrogenase Mo-binding subunit|nr:xanthine dehydrogenase family protein molybdopterin-binding subunit [Candidatus Binatia bacterium]
MAKAESVIGARVARVEGVEKVSGSALYAADVRLPGALWGKILRSPYAHARIVQVDGSQAWKVDGVRAVITGKDVAGHYRGKSIRDIPVLCWDKVRYIGDRVAAFAAETAEAAEEALGRIHVEYEELPAVFDPLKAMEPGAPILHDNPGAYDGAPQDILVKDIPNVLNRLTWSKGDIEKGFREADLVLEHTFRLPLRSQGYIEPQSVMLAIEDDGSIQGWASTKTPFAARNELSKAVGLPPDRVRINALNVGGDFGGKGGAGDLSVAYFLAQQAKRPVRITLAHSEDLTTTNPDHLTVITVRTGVKRDGRIVARYLRAVHASGAYGGQKPGHGTLGGAGTAGPYRIENTYLEALQVYTNTVPGGFWRAPGALQAMFAVESHMDLVAKELSMDPAEFRLKNIVGEGEENALGKSWRGMKARETLQAALDAAGWKKSKPGPNYGRGLAMYERGTGAGKGWIVLTAERDGTLTVFTVSGDQGTGLRTVLCQTVATEMGVPVEQVTVRVGNTGDVPFSVDIGFGGSRSTNIGGHAAMQACSELRAKLITQAARMLNCAQEQVVYKTGRFSSRDNRRRSLSLSEVVAAGEGPITVSAQLEVPRKGSSTSFVAQVAEVEVDPETGKVRLHRFVTAHDVGTIINPVSHQGQIDGGAMMAIGAALTEELPLDEGKITTQNFGEYKLPNISDIPKFKTVLIHSTGGPGPYEAKGIGEMANVSPPAAIANAVDDAVGVRIFDLPVTAEKIFKALNQKH